MNKNHVKLGLFSLVFIIGIIILMNSVGLGTNAVENLLIRSGSLNNYEILHQQYIINYRTLGIILSILSGLGIVINTNVKP